MKYKREEYTVLFKGTNSNMNCKHLEYNFDCEFTMDIDDVKLCEKGFHACPDINNVFLFYPGPLFGQRMFECFGHVVDSDGRKVVCDAISFVRELLPHEIYERLEEIESEKINTCTYSFMASYKRYMDYVGYDTEYEKLRYILKHQPCTKYFTEEEMTKFMDHIHDIDYSDNTTEAKSTYVSIRRVAVLTSTQRAIVDLLTETNCNSMDYLYDQDRGKRANDVPCSVEDWKVYLSRNS